MQTKSFYSCLTLIEHEIAILVLSNASLLWILLEVN